MDRTGSGERRSLAGAPRISARLALVFVVLSGFAGGIGSARPAVAAACSTSWSIVSSVDPSGSDELTGATAFAANDAWAVGAPANGVPLAEHWNGTAWSQVSTQAAPTSSGWLYGLSGSSPTDVWAVGNYVSNKVVDGSHVNKTLIEHSTGGAFARVQSPNQGSRYNALNGVAAVSSTEAWAVGSRLDATHTHRTLIEKWDGTGWSIVPSPNRGARENLLFAVSGTAGDLWAVGFYDTNAGVAQVLTEHYDGVAWSVVAGKNPSASFNDLDSVVDLSPTDVWAVGYFIGAQGRQTLAEHYNGTAWKVVATPNPSSTPAALNGVAALGTNDVWAVGSTLPSSGTSSTLVEHRDASGWHIVSSPSPSGENSVLYAAAAAGGNAWGVGIHEASQPQTLVEQACGV